MNKSGKIGTAAETAVVNYLRVNGFPHVERRRLRGAKDAGDLTGIPGLLVEVKGGEQARNASDNKIDGWFETATVKAHENGCGMAMLVVARHRRNVSHWWAILTYSGWHFTANMRMYLRDACFYLREDDFGEPL